MLTSLQFHLAGVFLKIFLRNRQAILFSLFFPLIFIGAFSFSGASNDQFTIGVTDESQSPFSEEFIKNLEQEEIFNLIEGDFESLQSSLIQGDIKGLILIPNNFKDIDNLGALKFYVDASQTRQVSVIRQAIETSLLSVERKIRGKKRLNRMACLFLKNIFKKTPARWNCKEVNISQKAPFRLGIRRHSPSYLFHPH